MQDKPRYTFHYTPEAYFNGLDPAADYVPPGFEQEGFIHCTDGAENVARVATTLFRYDEQGFLVLYVDKTLVTSPIKYEDPDEIYPHIYGPLPRKAIVRVLNAWRDHDGFFLPMPDM
jgi:hypothetical protein